MKPKYLGAIAIVTIMAILCTVTACKKYSEGITWQANASNYPSQILIRFTNANSLSAKNPGSFNVTISGKDAGKVISGAGDKEFRAQNGFLALALESGTVPSVQNPITFNLYASAAGFAPITRSFTITDTTGFVTGISVVEYAHPADGTTALVKQTTLSNGISGAITLTTQKTATMAEASTITVEDGTQMLDVDGNAINASSLEWKIVHYGAVNQASLNAFPGGFIAPDITGKDGNVIPGGVHFFTEGLLSMKLSAGGTEVKKFSKPLKVSMEISNSIVNPETNAPVKVGDELPIWSQEEETGHWKYESTATVFMNSNGKLAVNFNVPHLSTYNCDNIQTIPSYCQNAVKVRISSSSSFIGGRYDVIITGINGFYYAYRTNIPLYNGATINFLGLPQSGGTVTIKNSITGKVVGTQTFTACQQIVNVNTQLPATNISNPVTVKLLVSAMCTNENAEVNPTGFAYVESPGFNFENFVNIINGVVDPFILQDNADYNIYIFYAGNVYQSTGHFDKNGATYSSDDGKLSGTSTYDASTNTVTLTLKVLVKCN